MLIFRENNQACVLQHHICSIKACLSEQFGFHFRNVIDLLICFQSFSMRTFLSAKRTVWAGMKSFFRLFFDYDDNVVQIFSISSTACVPNEFISIIPICSSIFMLITHVSHDCTSRMPQRKKLPQSIMDDVKMTE